MQHCLAQAGRRERSTATDRRKFTEDDVFLIKAYAFEGESSQTVRRRMIILRSAYDSADPARQRTILYNAVVERHTGTQTGLPNMYG